MAKAQQLSFELERFEWISGDRLEVVGRWHGITGRRLARPVLIVDTGGERERLAALPPGRPAVTDEPWRARFAWPRDPDEIETAELEIGRTVVVELPTPRRRRRRDQTPAAEDGVRAELDELRAQIAELRDARSAAVARAEAAEADAEEAERAASAVAEAEAEADAPGEGPGDEGLRSEVATLQERHEALERDLERLRERHDSLHGDHTALQEAHDGLGDQHAALIARSGDLRGELDETLAENERHRPRLASSTSRTSGCAPSSRRASRS